MSCIRCKSPDICKDGLRVLNDYSTAQRFLCHSCGYRFSEKLYKQFSTNNERQLSVILQDCSKKLVTSTEIKTVGAGEATLVEYAWKSKKKGNGELTIQQRCYLLGGLIKKGADLNNPDTVETILATEPEYNDKTQPSKKYNVVNAYVSYTKTMKISWDSIRVKYEAKQAFIATPEELKLFIDSAGHRFGTYLQVLYNTGARRGEIAHLKWIDINTANRTISINEPEKNSRSRMLKVPESTIQRIQTLEHKYGEYVFSPIARYYGTQFEKLRKKLIRIHPDNSERLKQIHLHCFRYNFAHTQIKQLKPQKQVQQNLGHKSSSSTDRYTNTVIFNEYEWETARATTIEEAEALATKGYTKYDEINGVHLYRRLKP